MVTAPGVAARGGCVVGGIVEAVGGQPSVACHSTQVAQGSWWINMKCQKGGIRRDDKGVSFIVVECDKRKSERSVLIISCLISLHESGFGNPPWDTLISGISLL